jgi:hypothetical protein
VMVRLGTISLIFYGKIGYEITKFGAWRSLVAHLLWEQGVGGSNPLAPTLSLTIAALKHEQLLYGFISLTFSTRIEID